MPAVQIIALIVELAQAGSSLLAQIQSAIALVKKLQDEGRDATPEEWAALDAAFDASKKALDDAIAARRAAGG